ncbi:hypothetical protein [Haloplanus natans]|uniref:hypothetical protein n=1 Tax=Haloplanus natans TaxID=376171 RepID=UPI000677622C|nr:hypothetical protein [Haloplanus natans]
MTGVFDRLRAWLGTVLGGETTDTDGDTAESDAPDRRVVHRDDRPLETPSTMDRPARVEVPDAEAESEAHVDGRPAPADASIPGAEAPGTAGHDDAEAPPADGPETDAAVACSVCGTTVEDPSAACPLCRSTDVVPVADAPSEAEEGTPAHARRTAASTADDDAVERLRDVREGE